MLSTSLTSVQFSTIVQPAPDGLCKELASLIPDESTANLIVPCILQCSLNTEYNFIRWLDYIQLLDRDSEFFNHLEQYCKRVSGIPIDQPCWSHLVKTIVRLIGPLILEKEKFVPIVKVFQSGLTSSNPSIRYITWSTWLYLSQQTLTHLSTGTYSPLIMKLLVLPLNKAAHRLGSEPRDFILLKLEIIREFLRVCAPLNFDASYRIIETTLKLFYGGEISTLHYAPDICVQITELYLDMLRYSETSSCTVLLTNVVDKAIVCLLHSMSPGLAREDLLMRVWTQACHHFKDVRCPTLYMDTVKAEMGTLYGRFSPLLSPGVPSSPGSTVNRDFIPMKLISSLAIAWELTGTGTGVSGSLQASTLLDMVRVYLSDHEESKYLLYLVTLLCREELLLSSGSKLLPTLLSQLKNKIQPECVTPSLFLSCLDIMERYRHDPAQQVELWTFLVTYYTELVSDDVIKISRPPDLQDETPSYAIAHRLLLFPLRLSWSEKLSKVWRKVYAGLVNSAALESAMARDSEFSAQLLSKLGAEGGLEVSRVHLLFAVLTQTTMAGYKDVCKQVQECLVSLVRSTSSTATLDVAVSLCASSVSRASLIAPIVSELNRRTTEVSPLADRALITKIIKLQRDVKQFRSGESKPGVAGSKPVVAANPRTSSRFLHKLSQQQQQENKLMSKITPGSPAQNKVSNVTPSSPTPNRKDKSKLNTSVHEDGDTQDYVFIPPATDPVHTPLTQHQKEKLKRRPSDIPALYQDLSQSSQDVNSQDSLALPVSCPADQVTSLRGGAGGLDLDENAVDLFTPQAEETLNEINIENQINKCGDEGMTSLPVRKSRSGDTAEEKVTTRRSTKRNNENQMEKVQKMKESVQSIEREEDDSERSTGRKSIGKGVNAEKTGESNARPRKSLISDKLKENSGEDRGHSPTKRKQTRGTPGDEEREQKEEKRKRVEIEQRGKSQQKVEELKVTLRMSPRKREATDKETEEKRANVKETAKKNLDEQEAEAPVKEEAGIKTPTRQLSKRKCSSPFNTKDFILDLPKKRKSASTLAGSKDKSVDSQSQDSPSQESEKQSITNDANTLRKKNDTKIDEAFKAPESVSSDTEKCRKSILKLDKLVKEDSDAQLPGSEDGSCVAGDSPRRKKRSTLRKSILKLPRTSDAHTATRKSVKFHAKIARSNTTLEEEKSSRTIDATGAEEMKDTAEAVEVKEEPAEKEVDREIEIKMEENEQKSEVTCSNPNKDKTDGEEIGNEIPSGQKEIDECGEKKIKEIADNLEAPACTDKVGDACVDEVSNKDAVVESGCVADSETQANVAAEKMKPVAVVDKAPEAATEKVSSAVAENLPLAVAETKSVKSAPVAVLEAQTPVATEEKTEVVADKVPEAATEKVSSAVAENKSAMVADKTLSGTICDPDRSRKCPNVSRVELNIRKKTIQEVYRHIHLYRSNEVSIIDMDSVLVNREPLRAYEKFKNQILYNTIKFLLSDNIVYAVTDVTLKRMFGPTGGLHQNNTTIGMQHCTIASNTTLFGNETLGKSVHRTSEKSCYNDTMATTLGGAVAMYRQLNADTKLGSRCVNHMLVKKNVKNSFNFISNFSFILLSHPVELNMSNFNLAHLWSSNQLSEILEYFRGLNSVPIFLITVLTLDKNFVDKKFKTRLADKLKRLGDLDKYFVKYLNYVDWTYKDDLPEDFNIYETESTLIRIENVKFNFYIAEDSDVSMQIETRPQEATTSPEETNQPATDGIEEAKIEKTEEKGKDQEKTIQKVEFDNLAAAASTSIEDLPTDAETQKPKNQPPHDSNKQIESQPEATVKVANKMSEPTHKIVKEINSTAKLDDAVEETNQPSVNHQTELNDQVSAKLGQARTMATPERVEIPETQPDAKEPAEKVTEIPETQDTCVDKISALSPARTSATPAEVDIPDSQQEETNERDNSSEPSSLEIIESSQEASRQELRSPKTSSGSVFAHSTPFPSKLISGGSTVKFSKSCLSAEDITAESSGKSVDTLERPILESNSEASSNGTKSSHSPRRFTGSPRVSRIFPPAARSPPRQSVVTPPRSPRSPHKVNSEEQRRTKKTTPPQQASLGGRGAAMLELLESGGGSASSLLQKKRVTPTRLSSTPSVSPPTAESPKSSRRSSRMLSLVKSCAVSPARDEFEAAGPRLSSPSGPRTPRETRWREQHWTPGRTPTSGILRAVTTSGKKKLKVNFMEHPVSEELHFDKNRETLNNSLHILYNAPPVVGKKLQFQDPAEDNQEIESSETKENLEKLASREERIQKLKASIKEIPSVQEESDEDKPSTEEKEPTGLAEENRMDVADSEHIHATQDSDTTKDVIQCKERIVREPTSVIVEESAKTERSRREMVETMNHRAMEQDLETVENEDNSANVAEVDARQQIEHCAETFNDQDIYLRVIRFDSHIDEQATMSETTDALNGSFEGAQTEQNEIVGMAEEVVSTEQSDETAKATKDLETTQKKNETAETSKDLEATQQEDGTVETTQELNSFADEYDETFDSLVEEIEEIMDSQEQLERNREATLNETFTVENNGAENGAKLEKESKLIEVLDSQHVDRQDKNRDNVQTLDKERVEINENGQHIESELTTGINKHCESVAKLNKDRETNEDFDHVKDVGSKIENSVDSSNLKPCPANKKDSCFDDTPDEDCGQMKKQESDKLDSNTNSMDSHNEPIDSERRADEESSSLNHANDERSSHDGSLDASRLAHLYNSEGHSPQPPSQCHLTPTPALSASPTPLYPSLLSCGDVIDDVILSLLCADTAQRGLLSTCLVKLGIKTVGHLASLTRLQASNLPLGKRKEDTIVAALRKYQARPVVLEQTETKPEAICQQQTQDSNTDTAASTGRELHVLTQQVNADQELCEHELDDQLEQVLQLAARIMEKKRQLKRKRTQELPESGDQKRRKL